MRGRSFAHLFSLRAAAALAAIGFAAVTPAIAHAGGYAAAPNTQPTVDTIAGSSSFAAPWNTSQGVSTFDGNPLASYPGSDLLPTFSFAGQETSFTPATNGASIEPNVAVYPSAAGAEPFPSGYVGTPGPLSGYCTSSESDAADTNESSSPLSQPKGEALPFAPYYFPYIVRNRDGSLTGYFDWRPKDADEAVIVARSWDGGKSWTAEGEALEQNQSYCPSGDTNDDGEGHPYVADLGHGSELYTLQRAIGDYAGTGLLTHPVDTNAKDPLASVPATQSIGSDPDTFATVSTAVSSTAVNVPVSTLGGDAANGNSTSVTDSSSTTMTVPDASALPDGPALYEDVTGVAAGSTPPIITCAGTSGSTGNSPELTGCTSSTGVSVNANDNLVEVIGTVASLVNDASGDTVTTIPYGPQNEAGTLGTDVSLNATSTNSDTITYVLNNNAPNRYYVDGSTIYCTQANADPTTKIEFLCTTTNPDGITVNAGDAVTADPIVPAAAHGGPTTETNGLISPDGIIGALPSSANNSWGEPRDGHVVLYTEKLLNYFIEGGINGTITSPDGAVTTSYTAPGATKATKSTVALPGTTPTDYNISPFPTEAEQLPASGSFNVYVGYSDPGTPPAGFAAVGIATLTCTGWNVDTKNPDQGNPNLDTIDLIGCTGGDPTGTVAAGHQGNWVAGPGAAIELPSVLGQIGEGNSLKASHAEKLFGNNEDYEVVRAAYTTDGVNFTDLGAISGTTSGTGSTDGDYSDLTNPYQQNVPQGGSVGTFDAAAPQGLAPTSLAAGSTDTVELRWPGARGTVVVNRNGSLGLFLSGAWASDGDSDAFNQIFYSQSTDGGKTWSVPTVVLSTDYTFSASIAQDQALAAGTYSPLGVSAYYSGRAYDPTVVQNPNGTLTLVFAGYRLPSPVTAAQSPVGTGTTQYNEGATVDGTFESDPAIYRNILTEQLWPQQAPSVSTGPSRSLSTTEEAVSGTVQSYEDPTSVTVAYGTSPSHLTDTVAAGSVAAGTKPSWVSQTLTGLEPGTTYYYEVEATNASGTTVGRVERFTTPQPPRGPVGRQPPACDHGRTESVW